jgi:4-amino-4-deoxy-L-arabinose transferase-like glycosyltransferase
MGTQEVSKSYWGKYKWIAPLAVIGLFVLGLGLRLYDLTDPPLDSAYRQLHAAIIARGMYYQMLPKADPTLRQAAVDLWHYEDKFEPPIFERIVAVTYLAIGGEHLWVARIYSALFWLIGGLALFLLARKMTSLEGAIVALAFYLVLPFGAILSRRFQPDPFMVMWINIAALALFEWDEKRDLKSAIWVGLACAIAVVVKVFAVFFIAPMAIAMVLVAGRLRQNLRNLQIWLMAAIMIAIPAIIYFVLRTGTAGYLSFWSTSFIGMLIQPSFYVRWLELLNTLFGGLAVILALAGVLIAGRRARALLVSLWLGYLVFGLFEPWQISTHDYYSLVLVPIIALSVVPIADAFFTRLIQQSSIWKFLFVGVALLALAIPAWKIRLDLVNQDSRINWAAWTNIGKVIPKDGTMIALTDDYGTWVEYFGWRTVKLWPTTQDLNLVAARGGNTEPDFQKNFIDQTAGMDYFLVTAIYELGNQPQLKEYLYSHYAYTEGDGYILFYLHSPLALR